MSDGLPGATPLLRIYRGATRGLAPIAGFLAMRKLARHGVSPTRQRERMGHASLPRPDGTLVWLHGASVGESLSAVTLVSRMAAALPDAEFLITSGTATSAKLVEQRLPPRTRHQFAALDAPGPVRRFLKHWRPTAAIFVESELWPVTLRDTRRTGAKLALVNARLSAKSVESWSKYPETARSVMDLFSVLLTQNSEMATNLRKMGAAPDRIRPGSNLKAFSAPLPIDGAALAQIRQQLAERPVWVASSTHRGEEEVVLQAHRHLLKHHPDLCLVLAPRHPERGDEVSRLVHDAGLSMSRRSHNESSEHGVQVYLADTLGELGTWYALSPIVFLGGSLQPIGGHNPFEVARANAAVISGPGVQNFAETFDALKVSGGAIEVSDAPSLAAAVDRWLTDASSLKQARAACSTLAARQDSALDGVVETLCRALELNDG
ncbi:3-deoxy-D-manno-octulosonic acid transferase [Rhodobacteraceae bacterium M382]|nr:3-deoxy-D-manno-octulosonic acid transferase [Rhodobacteraceae bacterium M382]